MNSYQSQMTFLYFDDFEGGKHFLQEVLCLTPVYAPDWAVVYQAAGSAYIGAVDAKRGSVSSHVRGGFLVSLTVADVLPYYERLKGQATVRDLTEIKVFEDIGVKSFFFKGPEGYDFEIQQFTSPSYDFTQYAEVKLKWQQEIIDTEQAFNQASAIDGAKGWTSFFLDDGKMLTKGGTPIVGQDAIHQAMAPFFNLNKLVFKWEPRAVEVSDDGTLAYSYGNYHRTYEGPEGAEVEEKGMYMSIWKRDDQGNWRVAADVGN